MDIIFHIVLGILLSKNFLNGYNFIVVIFSLLPDLIGALPYEMEKFYRSMKFKGNKIKKYLSFTKRTKTFSEYQKIIYKSTHNLFAWLFFTLIARILWEDIYIVLSISYFLHLFFDSYTHEGDFAMQPFYPLKFFIKGKSWTLSKRVMLINWTFLILFLIYLEILK
jgi:membrane-bound metal-dependent hydrolase YbcI (DUF457 family)